MRGGLYPESKTISRIGRAPFRRGSVENCSYNLIMIIFKKVLMISSFEMVQKLAVIIIKFGM